MAQASHDQNRVTTLLGVSNADGTTPVAIYADPVTHRLLVDLGGGGTGTVTDVSVVTANGFAGTVANSTTTPAITLETTVSGILKGDGTAMSAADPNTDYAAVAFKTIAVSGQSDVVADTPIDTLTLAAGSNITITTNAGTDTITIAASGSTGVATVVGTADRITVDSTDPANPVVNIAATYVGQASITTLGTIGSGVWNGTAIVGQYGGTGVANTGKTITVSGNTIIGSNTDTVQFTTTGNTNVTLPTSGTLATTAQIPTNVVTAAATFATDESILRSDGTSRGSQATSTNATLTDGGAMVLASTATAASFIPTSNSAPSNGMFLPAGNTLGWGINSAEELRLTSTALSPGADGGSSLGTTALGWQNLFANTGFVINIENGDWVATHTAGILTVGTGDLRVTTAGTNTASVVTVGGTQTVTNKIVRHTVEPAVDDTYTGQDITGFNAGATIAQWEAVYLNSSSNWVLTDADAAATAGGVFAGLAAAAGTNGNPLTVVLNGVIRNDGWNWATVGAPLYLGTTAGAIVDTAPSGTDDVIRIIGYVLSDDCIWLLPSNDWATHT